MSSNNTMLSGITILELGQVIAGAFGGTILSDLGAEVIKVEPITGDSSRNPTIAPIGGESAVHLSMNRGKKSIAIDLKSEEGLAIFYKLASHADAVIDNFRPGVMGRLGIDHRTLCKYNPDIVTASVTGFGENGPARDRAAFDLVIQAHSGLLDMTGDSQGPPARVGVPIADLAGGLFACISVLSALLGRKLHGGGQHADVAMLDSLVSLQTYDALAHLNEGVDATRQGTAHAYMVPWQAFAAKDGYLVIAVRDEKFWRNLCEAIDRPDLISDVRTVDNRVRVENREFVVSVLSDVFRHKTKSEWTKILDKHDIPSAPVNDIREVFSDPQIQSRGMVQSYDHPSLGEVRYTPSPMKFSEWKFRNLPTPELGEHTMEILVDRLGYSTREVDRLERNGVLVCSPKEVGQC